MSVLRRPDDHRRNVRRRAPCAFFSADPDQDRHLMIAIAVLPASQRRSASLPAARRSRRALSSQRPQTLSKRPAHPRPLYAPDRTSSSSSLPPIRLGASGPRSQTCVHPRLSNPHRSSPPNRAPPPRGFLLTRLSNAGPPSSPARLQRAGVRNPSPFCDVPGRRQI